MKKLVLLDEIHLTLLVPRDLSAHDVRGIRKVLSNRQFNRRLERVIRNLLRCFPTVAAVRVRVSR